MKVASDLPEIIAIADNLDCCPVCEEREHLFISNSYEADNVPVRSPEGNPLVIAYCNKCNTSAMSVARETEATVFKLKERMFMVYHHRIYRRLTR